MPSTTDALTIIAIGNPGSGKSTTLNYLAQQKPVLFKSGVSYGSGMTYALDSKEVNGITYCDTPGLNDPALRKPAGEAISKALKKGGKTKILFFITLESGRSKNDDVTTMNLILQAAPEIGNNYGIIVNKIKAKQAKGLKSAENWSQLLAGIFAGFQDSGSKKFGLGVGLGLLYGLTHNKNQCGAEFVQGVQLCDDADDEKDYLVPKGELITLEGHPVENFVWNLVPTIDLTPDKADDVDTSSFEEKQEEMIKLKEEALADKEKLKELQKEIEMTRVEQSPVQMMLGGLGRVVVGLVRFVAEPPIIASRNPEVARVFTRVLKESASK